MTVRNDVVLWDNGEDRLSLFSVPPEQQYKYIEGKPCVTFGLSYENKNYKGCDIFTVFDRFYTELIDEMEKTLRSLRGGFRIEDKGADTDGYVDFEMANGKLTVNGQLGASFSGYSLRFAAEADQTLVGALLQSLAGQ